MSRQEVLVDADWVAEHAGDENIVLVEVDEDTTAYDGGHISGAIKLDWKKDLQDPVRRDFINKEQFEKLLSERGIGNDDTVVLYGGNNNWFAAYAYWYFKLYGHDKVLLLDGGRQEVGAGRARPDQRNGHPAGHELHGHGSEPQHSGFSRRGGGGDRHQEPGRCAAHPDEYAGRLLAPAHLPQEQAQRGGHIPTAVNVPWSKAANDDGTFKSDNELKVIYSDGA